MDIMLNWNGFFLENKTEDGHLIRSRNHRCSGIYAVYAGQQTEAGHCSIRKLLYVGQSENVVGDRLTDEHEHYNDWKRCLKRNEVLYFCIADVCSSNLNRAEAALIYKLKPECNVQSKDNFCYEATHIISYGAFYYDPDNFNVGNSLFL